MAEKFSRIFTSWFLLCILRTSDNFLIIQVWSRTTGYWLSITWSWVSSSHLHDGSDANNAVEWNFNDHLSLIPTLRRFSQTVQIQYQCDWEKPVIPLEWKFSILPLPATVSRSTRAGWEFINLRAASNRVSHVCWFDLRTHKKWL